MDDIFDEVDSILNEGDSSEEETTNFNESELQDIMSEIDDLEKEFEIDEHPMSLQDKIDAELAIELEEFKEEAVHAKAKVMTFEKATPLSPSTIGSKSGVSFQATGQMSLNLDFMIGQETAKLVIDPIKGMIITLSGVELCINEDSGCTVEMDNGMKFTIPLSSQANSLKKKSA